MAKYNDSVRLVIKCNRAAADSMTPLLKELKFMGNAGCSRGIKIEDYDGHNSSFGFDGDGPDRIDSIELDGKLIKANADMLDYFVKKFKKEGLYKEGMEKEFDPKEVAMGMQIEKEHTDSKELLREIVLDHLVEDAHYYTKLKKWESQKSIGEARMNLVIPLTKGAAGTRGVPDGSGPEGKGPTGRKQGGCPKREDYKDTFEYNKAMMKWKAKNKTEKSIVYMPTEMLKGLGKVGSTQSHLNKVGSSIPEHKGSVKGKGNAKGTTPPQKPTGGGTTNKPEGTPKAESSKKGGNPPRVKGRKPGDKPPYKNYKATASGSESSAADNYLKMTSVKDGKARFLKLGSIHRAKFDHAGNCIRVTVDGKRYPVQNHLVRIPSGVFRIDGMVTVATKVIGAKK